MEKIKQYPVLATIGMLLVLSVAVGLDRWLEAAQAKAGRSFNLTPVVTTAVLANLMLVFLWLGLLWLALIQPQPNGLVATLYLTVGGLLTLSPIMAAKGWMDASVLDVLNPTSYLSLTGTFLTALGTGILLAAKSEYWRPE